MHILITGANGFVGSHLSKKILREPQLLCGSEQLQRLTLLDLDFPAPPESPLVTQIKGSFADDSVIQQAMGEHPVDLVFHLASVPSGMTESNYELGVEVNILGTMGLLNAMKKQSNIATMVFASSIAVYGKPGADIVDESTLPLPNLSYGSQKVIGESLVSDHCRRQWIKGCSVRLPGIVMRPSEPNGAVSIFFSDLIRNLSAGKSFVCPVSEQAKSWLMSISCCVDNLINAAKQDQGKHSTWTFPALHVSMAELVEAIGILYPEIDVQNLISYEPDPWVEENFGSYPPLSCPNAELAGFRHDDDLLSLVKNSLT